MCRAGTHPDPSSVVTKTKGRPGGVLAPDLDALADGYPDRPPAGYFMGFDRTHRGHLASVAVYRDRIQTARQGQKRAMTLCAANG